MQRNENLVQIGANIRQARKAAGLSQEALAEKLDVSRNYVGMIERGERNSTTLTLLKVARTLGVAPAVLFAGLLPTMNGANR